MLRLTMVLVGSLMFLSSSAQAIGLSVTVATNVGDSGAQGGGFSSSEHASSTSVINSGTTAPDVAGNTVTAATRYAQIVWADDSGGTPVGFTTDYRVTLDITAAGAFDLQIDTTRLGALTLVDDSFFSTTMFAHASIGAVSADRGGSPEASLDMPGISFNTAQNLTTLGYGSSLESPIDQSSSVTISGLSGNLQILLDFEWTTTVLGFNDEAAVRLGGSHTISFGDVFAANYPGIGSRTQALDGHFVSFTATVAGAPIPEPTSVLLMAAGLAVVGAGVGGRRNRRTSGS